MKLRTPREHGTWGMFFVPFALGWGAAARVNVPVLLLLIASAALFLSRESLLFWWRARHHGKDTADSGRALLLLAAVAALFTAPLLLIYQLYALIPLGIAGILALIWNAESAIRRQGRTVLTEFLAVASASMNAAAANYAAKGAWTTEAVLVWTLSALYFASSIFYVKLRVQDAHGKTPESIVAARRSCALYHFALAAALVAGVATRSLPLFCVVAFGPILVRAFLQVLRPSKQLNLKKIGWLEVAYSIIFLVVLSAGLARV